MDLTDLLFINSLFILLCLMHNKAVTCAHNGVLYVHPIYEFTTIVLVVVVVILF